MSNRDPVQSVKKSFAETVLLLQGKSCHNRGFGMESSCMYLKLRSCLHLSFLQILEIDNF